MDAQTHWVVKGELTALPNGETPDAVQERELMERQGYVKISTSEEGTFVKWALFAANWASLFFAMEWIFASKPPYHLQYYIAGWFEEIIDDPIATRDRIHVILGKSDIYLPTRTFVEEADADRPDMPELLRRAFTEKSIAPEYSVDCAWDNWAKKFKVQRIGTKSTMAELFGLNPVSFPCQTTHSYDHMVSKAYPAVMETGVPRYDHVLAAMVRSNSEIVWLPYQRVILPSKFSNGKRGVSIITAKAKVDISLL
jgi:hypothetical protein